MKGKKKEKAWVRQNQICPESGKKGANGPQGKRGSLERGFEGNSERSTA